MKQPKFILKGIVRGTYSNFQQFLSDSENPPVLVLEGNTLEDVVSGLALPEWIYILYVNGKRIVDPAQYLKREGIWNLCIREEAV